MHPIAVDLEYRMERSRLTTFFRLLVAIPWIVWNYLFSIASLVATVIAWFVLLFTKRYPAGLYRFNSAFLRFGAQLAAYLALATDRVPTFSGKERDDDVLKVSVANPQAEYRRSRTFFKWFTYLPIGIVGGALGYVLGGAGFVTWFRVLATGKQSATMHDAQRVSLAYVVRGHAFMMLLTETHPRMLDLPPQTLPANAPAMPVTA